MADKLPDQELRELIALGEKATREGVRHTDDERDTFMAGAKAALEILAKWARERSKSNMENYQDMKCSQDLGAADEMRDFGDELRRLSREITMSENEKERP